MLNSIGHWFIYFILISIIVILGRNLVLSQEHGHPRPITADNNMYLVQARIMSAEETQARMLRRISDTLRKIERKMK